MSRFLIGSVAESVLRSAVGDVLVIPTAAVTPAREVEFAAVEGSVAREIP